jgi:microcystin-dependent protein
MAISRVKSWVAGEELTANDLNNEFNNIINNSLTEPFVASQNVDINGQLLILDANGDTLLDASVNDVVDVTIAGADDFRFAVNTFTALSGSSVTVESGTLTMTSGDVVMTAGRVLQAKSSDVASASSVTLPTTGNVFDLTGSTTITSFSTTQAGTTFRVRYTGTGLNLIYNATSLITPYATDYRLVTNEVFDLVSMGGGNYYIVPITGAPTMEPGVLFPGWFTADPTGALLATGTAVNCTTYYALAKKLVPNASTLGNSGTSVGTITADASTDQLTLVAHGLAVNDIVHFTNTGGALPTGISANTVYYVQTVVSSSVFKISTTRGGSALDITGNGTGTNTVHNKVNLPDLRGRALVALDNLGGSAASIITSSSTNGANSTTLGGVGGAQTHTLVTGEMPSHTHSTSIRNMDVGGTTEWGLFNQTGTGATTAWTSTSAGSGSAHSNTQPWMAVGMAIRF